MFSSRVCRCRHVWTGNCVIRDRRVVSAVAIIGKLKSFERTKNKNPSKDIQKRIFISLSSIAWRARCRTSLYDPFNASFDRNYLDTCENNNLCSTVNLLRQLERFLCVFSFLFSSFTILSFALTPKWHWHILSIVGVVRESWGMWKPHSDKWRGRKWRWEKKQIEQIVVDWWLVCGATLKRYFTS